VERKNCLYFRTTCVHPRWRERTVYTSEPPVFTPGGEKELFTHPNHLCSPSVERKNCLYFRATCVHPRWRERTVYTSEPPVFTPGGEKELFILPNHLCSPPVERKNCLYFRTTCIHPRNGTIPRTLFLVDHIFRNSL
jgi:hypothetical protein